MIKIKYIIILFITIFSFNCLSSESIYDLNIKLQNTDANIVDIKDLKGKIQIFSMIYTRCKTVCPAILSNMKKMEEAIPKNMMDKIQFTLVTLDPENDRTNETSLYAIRKNITHWNFFRASKEDTLKLALATGIRYKKESSNEYTHSNTIVIIGKNGDVKMRQPGLDKDYKKFIKVIILSYNE